MSFAGMRGLVVRGVVVATVVALPLGVIGFTGEQTPNPGVSASEQIVLVSDDSDSIGTTTASANVAQTNFVFASHPVSSGRARAVELALSKVGSPYRWGATGPSSFDCSGLVDWAFEQAGISVPRTSRAQSQSGTPVSRDQLQPGDLVFFYSPVSHVGIYIGDGMMVHASTSGKPVAISPIEGRRFNSARRY